MRCTCLLLVCAFALTSGNLWAASAHQDSIQRLQMSTDVLHSILNAPDKSISEEVIDGVKCIVVIPNLVKGGFVVGGEYGRGIASCRTAEGWSAPVAETIARGRSSPPGKPSGRSTAQRTGNPITAPGNNAVATTGIESRQAVTTDTLDRSMGFVLVASRPASRNSNGWLG